VAERLEVESLSVAFGGGQQRVVRDVSFSIEPGEAYALVGESGSGKTLTSRAVLGLLPTGARVTGRIQFGGISLLDAAESELNGVRGAQIAMVFQDPGSFLNPLLRVGDAISQVMRSHERVSRREARKLAVALMARVGIRDAESRYRDYPHEFSGGMQQRVLIAMALAARPTLLLADEPTTALDVIVQAEILRLLDRLRREEGMSLLLVSHDFSVVAGVCTRVGVMYAGQLIEEGSAADVLHRPRHPYTRGLIESLPERAASGPLPFIPGAPPDPGEVPVGCAFAARCPLAAPACTVAPIPLVAVGAGHLTRCIRSDLLTEAVIPRVEATRA
jgi:oligopeptide/dipeptide ABC transporter ATP-binding protein